MLKENDKAPDFELKDSMGKKHTLSQYKGKKVILYFYPKDDTPGCTKEACNFRDSFVLFKNAVIIGISADSTESHKKFAHKYKLPFILLSDPKKEVIKKYGVLKEKSMFGNTFLGIVRSTFIIDEAGKIKKVYGKVEVDGHDKDVLGQLSK